MCFNYDHCLERKNAKGKQLAQTRLIIQMKLPRVYVSHDSFFARWTDKLRFITRGQEAVLKGYQKVLTVRSHVQMKSFLRISFKSSYSALALA